MASAMETTPQAITRNDTVPPVQVEPVHQRGNYRGEAVQATSEASKLSEAAEEIGMAVAHRIDRRSLGQRQIRQGQAATIGALARIAGCYHKLPNMPREKAIQALVEELASLERLTGGPPKADVRGALQTFDPDVTHQFAALELARDYFEAAGDNAELRIVLDEVHGEFGRADVARDIRAGFAAAGIAAGRAATLESDPATVRDTYRALLRDARNMGQLFDALTCFDITKHFGEVVETFMSIAGRDLEAAEPSAEPAVLHGLLTELGRLKKLQTVVEGSRALIDETERSLPCEERGLDTATALTSRLLHFTAKTTAAVSDARGLMGGFDHASPQTRVMFGNGLRNLHALLPDDMFPCIQVRLQQVSTLRALLDRLVAAEVDAYEEHQADLHRMPEGKDAG